MSSCLQIAEIKNGRLAMIGVGGIVHQVVSAPHLAKALRHATLILFARLGGMESLFRIIPLRSEYPEYCPSLGSFVRNSPPPAAGHPHQDWPDHPDRPAELCPQGLCGLLRQRVLNKKRTVDGSGLRRDAPDFFRAAACEGARLILPGTVSGTPCRTSGRR